VINLQGELIQILSIDKMISFINTYSLKPRQFSLTSKTQETRNKVDSINNITPYLVFKMAKEEFAISIELIREIILPQSNPTKIADALPEVIGLITLRDDILISVDFRKFFGVRCEDSNKNRLIILDYNFKNIAILVDEILGIMHIDIENLDKMPKKYQDERISGVVTKEDSDDIISILSDNSVISLIDKIQSYDENTTKNNTEKIDNDVLQRVIPFELSGEEFAFDINDINEIIRYSTLTPIPNTSDNILGLINLRGSMIPIVSLYGRLGLSPSKINDDTKILIVNIGNGLQSGFIVDRITGIVDVRAENISDNSKDSDIFPEIIILENGNRIILKMNIDGILESSIKELNS